MLTPKSRVGGVNCAVVAVTHQPSHSTAERRQAL
jgi:hypothetical protein